MHLDRAKVPDLERAYGNKYRALYDALSSFDPLGTFSRTETYRPMLGTLMPHWQEATSAEELERIFWTEWEEWELGSISPETREKVDEAVHDAWERVNGPEARMEVSRDAEEARSYAALYYSLLKAIHLQDPIGIAYLPKEYALEVECIIAQSGDVHSLGEMYQLVLEVFLQMFGDTIGSPWGKEDKYRKITEQAWELWQEYKNSL